MQHGINHFLITHSFQGDFRIMLNEDTPEYEALNDLLYSKHPINMLEACGIVASVLLEKLQGWSETLAESNRECEIATGEKVTPADPCFGGLIMAVIQVIMEPRNAPGLKEVADALNIPEGSRVGVRTKFNRLLDDLGFQDDRHFFN
jgi:hypothetical protein